ncbi:MAG TPA: PEP-CTERM sorting domain-containing protein [Phenylobacterium sp.]|nr:PEP-CTERM sorting domain-containing protein [Phenylobacterium sp.]
MTGAPGSRSAGSRAVARRTAFSPLEALGDWRAEVSDEAAGETLNLAPDPVEDAAFALTQRRDGFGSDEVQSGSGSRGTADAGAMSSSGSAMSSGGGGLGAGGAQGPDVGGVATDSGNPMASDLTAPTAPGPVPEPETWTLLVLGAGLAGATLRRRARRVA